MTKLVTTLLCVCMAGVAVVGCDSGGGASNDGGASTGTGGAASGGSGGGAGGGQGTGGGSGGGAGSPADASSGGGGGAAPADSGASTGSGGAAGAGTGGSSSGAGGTGGTGGVGGAGGTGGAPVETWETFAKGFFESYCVSCHNDDKVGAATRDYHMMAVVMKEKIPIACGVAKSQADWSKRGCSGFPPARQFPVGNGARPSDADRDRLLRWIDNGTP